MTTYFKKGNAVLDILTIFIVLFIVGIFVVYFFSGVDPLQQDLANDFNESGDNWSRDYMTEQNEFYPKFWDAAIVFILFGLWMAAIISGFLLDTYPVFFIIIVMLIAPILFVGIILSNVYEDLLSTTDIIAYQGSFPMSFWIMTHLLPIGILLFLSVAGTIYGKNKLE